MQEMQQSTQSAAAAMPAMMDPTSAFDDSEFALGCECAYPSLQIERWGQDDGTGEAA
jgi:hypothetical protein